MHINKMSISRGIYKTLSKLNIKHVFGYPGGAILPVINEFYKSKNIKFITPRTEMGASFMAEGYAKMLMNKKPGVVVATSGPGATNLVTSLQNALMDGTPLIALTGQVSTSALGTDAFQEADIIGITSSCTKWNKMLKINDNSEEIIKNAYKLTLSGRPGPVLIDIPKDISVQQNGIAKNQEILKRKVFYEKIDKNIIEKLKKAKNPVVIAGQGVLDNNTISEFRRFVRNNKIPVTTTLLGLGAEDETSIYSMEMLGMHGSYTANKIVQRADLILVLGARLDDRVTGDVKKFGKSANDIIHMDIRASNKNRTVQDTCFVKTSVNEALKQLNEINITDEIKTIREGWIDKITKIKQRNNFIVNSNDKKLFGSEVLTKINDIVQKNKGNKYCIVADVGAHQMWAAQYIKYDFPRVKYITSGGLGSMGYAVPASIGAKIANNEYTVICVVGDGGFNMVFQELSTLSEYNIDVKIFVMNNNYQQMVRMWQDYFYSKKYIGVKNKNPKYDKVAESLGVKGIRLEKKNINQLEKILNNKGSVVVDCIIDENEYVFPMVLPGKGIDEMITK